MFSPEQLDTVLKDLTARLGGQVKSSCSSNHNNGNAGGSSSTTGAAGASVAGAAKIAITPAQALVIAGIIGGVLEVDSVLVDKAQTVEIVLTGSLKRKTELDRMLDKIGGMPFDDVLKALMDRL